MPNENEMEVKWYLNSAEIDAILLYSKQYSHKSIFKEIVGKCNWPLIIKRIQFDGDKPVAASALRNRDSFDERDFDRLIARLSELSLSCRIVCVRQGFIYVTETPDHSTNIDVKTIETFIKAFNEHLKEVEK